MLDFTKLELNTAEPVYVQIVSFVKRQIFTGTAEKGESLPSRRELAAILKINPNTVQKAFRLMEEEFLYGQLLRDDAVGVAAYRTAILIAPLLHVGAQYGLVAHHPNDFIHHILLCERCDCREERGKEQNILIAFSHKSLINVCSLS